MSKRSEKRRDAAEDVCRALRIAITHKQREADWMPVTIDYLLRWITLCPYSRDYVIPKSRRPKGKKPKLK